MKIAVDRTIVGGRPPLDMGPQADGSFAVAFCHEGVLLVAVMSPAEATAFGVGVIKGAAIAEAVRETAQGRAGATGSASPLATATGGNGGGG